MFSAISSFLKGSDEMARIDGALELNGFQKPSQLSIRKTSAPYFYELVAGDNSVLINPDLEFVRISNGFTFVIEGKVYEFTTQQQLDMFEKCYLECLYETLNGKSAREASLSELDALKTVAKIKRKKPQKKKFVKEDTEELLSIGGELFLYDPDSMMFVQQAPVVTVLILKQKLPFSYWLKVTHQDDVFVSQPVDSSMNAVFNDEHKSFIWVYQEQDQCWSWSVQFKDGYQKFKEQFGQYVFEAVNKESFSKVASENRSYLSRGYAVDDVEMVDAEGVSDDEESESEEEEVTRTPRKGKERIEYGGEPNTKNTNLAVSYVHNKSFVTRGNLIGVFKNEHDDIEYSTTIKDIRKDGDRKAFSPSKMMLHERDSALILMDKDRPNSLFRMDLEYGKVVDEWKIDESREVKDFTHDTKYGQIDPTQTFVGVSHNALFRIDPRQHGTKLVESKLNQYKGKNEFSAAVTTGKGDLVVASEKGDIRLYNSIEKRAKTHLAGYGDAIIGIDVTEDGQWILATCKTYLLLIPTEAKNDGGQFSGFTKSLGDKKPVPKRLQLKPEHVAWMNSRVSFTKAHFNTAPDTQEKSIVTSTGNYVITWNLSRATQGRNDYNIKHYPDTVVADRFQHGASNVIVALEDDITLATKKQFVSPVKAFQEERRQSGRR